MKEAMYRDYAKYYDMIYSHKDYKKEAEIITEAIKKNKKSKGKDLLEVACGSGKHLQYFKKHFNCTGMDLNEGILKIARKNVKGPKYVKGNMINFNLKKKFDVINCLFSAIGYVKTYPNLKKTLKNFYNHLNEGGVVMIESSFIKDNWENGRPWMDTYKDNNHKIARLSISERKGNIAILNFKWAIAERNKKIFTFDDKHELLLFDNDKVKNMMEDVGFKVKMLKKGFRDRPIFIGVK